MAATEALLTWSEISELLETTWNRGKEEACMPATMTSAPQPPDAPLQSLQLRLSAALAEAEQGRAREAALLRRAEKSEEAEEALASLMAELEAEAFTRITENKKPLAASTARHMEPFTARQLSFQATNLERRLQAALEDAAAWAQRYKALQQEAEQGMIREAALRRRAEIAEAAEEALASQMAELEAEAFTRITESGKSLVHDERCYEDQAEAIVRRQVAELETQLAEAEEALVAGEAKLRQVEEKNWWLEMCLEQVAQEGKKAVTLKRKQDGNTHVLSVPLAGFVRLKLWNPSSLSLTSPS